MAAEIQTDFAIKPNRLTVMANPVDSAGLRRDAARNTAEISGGVPRFMAAGRLVPQKGLDRLIPLFSDMPADAHLTIFGEGPEKERLMAIVAEAGLSSRITFAGFKPSLAADYAAADAFLMPSRWKGMPNAALEALCCGTRVIATAESGGIAEVAANAPAGAVTVCDDWDAFRDALRDFAASASRKTAADTMSVRPSLLPACYQRETVQKKFMSALETLLDNPT